MSPHVLNDAFERINFDRELAFEFFTKFSVFENGLKNSGYYKQSGRYGVQPDWEEFSKQIDHDFSEMINRPYKKELENAVLYFLRFPPRKQGIENNELVFKDNNFEDKILSERLSILIRCVRNNLFHGGKFEYERPRDTLLLQFSIIILEEWAELIPSVRNQLQQMR